MADIGNDVTLRLDQNVLTRRALAVPALREAYLEALSELTAIAQAPAPDDERGWLEREIDRQVGQIGDAIAEDARFPFTPDEVQADVEHLREFARRRAEFVQCQVANLSDPETPQQACSATAPGTPQGSR